MELQFLVNEVMDEASKKHGRTFSSKSEAYADILEEYPNGFCKRTQSPLELSVDEETVYKTLSYEIPIEIEEIIVRTTLNPTIVTYILLQLELRGLAIEHSGKRYLRIAKEGIK